MRVQIISYKNELDNKFKDYEFVYSTINSPKSFDEFDVNIISLQEKDIWLYNDSQRTDTVNCISDFSSLQWIINRANKSKTIIAFPQNIHFKYNYSISSKTFKNSKELKNILYNVCEIIQHIIPTNIKQSWSLYFENTTTIINEKEYEASFYFDTPCKILTTSKGSQKPTTVKYSDKVYFTSLNLSSSSFNLKDFLREIGLDGENSNLPEWLEKFNCFDDAEQNELIDTTSKKIEILSKNIEEANIKIQENLKYKSILVNSGNDLVSIVFDILEKILDCDLSKFIDEKREDFVIDKDNFAFVGEIKGVNSNVKYANISQTDTHCKNYMDILDAENRKSTIKGILIINTFRKLPLNEREPVNSDQVELAKKYNILIITTETLLKIFERFLKGEVSTDKIITVFSSEIGLADIQSF